VSRLIESSPLFDAARAFDTGGQPLRYRLTFEGLRLRRDIVRRIVDGVRQAVDDNGLENSPSHYAVRLALEETAEASHLWLVPAFEPDQRFAYRVRDVGASIDPVVAAGLARLARTHSTGVAIDPCCGSGTLLVERARLDPAVRLRGVDVSPTAIAAAKANVAAAGLADRIEIHHGDAAEAASWGPCAEALSNLPFGIRSARHDRDLPRLYRRIVAHLAHTLQRNGRAVLYTANAQMMTETLAAHRRQLTLVERRDVEAGGLVVGVWIVAPVASR